MSLSGGCSASVKELLQPKSEMLVIWFGWFDNARIYLEARLKLLQGEASILRNASPLRHVRPRAEI